MLLRMAVLIVYACISGATLFLLDDDAGKVISNILLGDT
jgi:hypothetical protein